ncbi:MAG: hypothetical protein JW973_03320 [Bacteroidales bacterium]|nr:hypothetical protein [Bacteroidales bacterium]
MQANSTILFSLRVKDALNRLGLRRSWTQPGKNKTVFKFNLLKFAYGDSRILPGPELKKSIYEGL